MPPKYPKNAKLIKPNLFKVKQAWKNIDKQEIEVGDYVSVSWAVDEAYGGGTRSQKGVLSELHRESGWFEISPSNQSPGHLRGFIYMTGMTMTKLSDADEVQSVKDQIEERSAPKVKPKKKPNPFLAKAGKS